MAIDPPAPITLNLMPVALPPFWARWLMRPLGWPFFSAMALTCLYIIWLERLPGSLIVLFEMIGALVAFGAAWLFRLVTRGILWRTYQRPMDQYRRGSRRFWLAAAVPAVMAIVLLAKIPMYAAFYVSAPALRQAAEDILAKEASAPSPPGSSSYTAKYVCVRPTTSLNLRPGRNGCVWR